MNLVKFQLALDRLIDEAIDAGLPLDDLSEELEGRALDLAFEAQYPEEVAAARAAIAEATGA